MQNEGDFSKGKKIYTLKVKSKKDYCPHQYMNPYIYLKKIRAAIDQKGWDIDIVEAKYNMAKNKAQKGFDATDTSRYDLEVDNNFNKVFESGDQFLDDIFSDAVSLQAPENYDPSVFQNLIQEERKKEQDKKIDDIKVFLDKLMRIHNQKLSSLKQLEIETFEMFRMYDHRQYKEGEFNIFIKGVMSEPVKQKLDEQKNSGQGLVIKAGNSNKEIHNFLHPTLSYEQSAQKVKNLYGISDWLLGCITPKQMSKDDDKSEYRYFSTEHLQTNINGLNDSCKIINYLIVNKDKDRIKSFQMQTYLFDRSILKTQLNMGQIKKIGIYKHTDKKAVDYYFHLAYPPKFFLSTLKKEVANTDSYITSWERIQNIFFLKNKSIDSNHFMRLFLFSNSILKITIKDGQSYKFQNSYQMLNTMISKFNDKITIQVENLDKPIQFKWKVLSLKSKFPYQEEFLQALRKVKDQNKAWIIKYFILIMVRYNHLYPSDVHTIIQQLENHPADIDVFIYVFWKIATDIWGYNERNIRFVDYVFNEVKSAKGLNRNTLMQLVGKNTDYIAQVFRLNLTPSGYLFMPPSPEMKGRLLKEFDQYSEFFMRVSICDDHEGTLKNQKYITREAFKAGMQKITVLNRKYIPLGWSPSQLRAYSLWYIHETNQAQVELRINREIVLSFLGNFDQIQNPAKRAARIGQCFSSSWTYDATHLKTEQIPDIRSDRNFMFTDGIGKAARNIFLGISLKLGIKELSVIQIRYRGCKGLLVMDDSLQKNKVLLRDSMIKYKCEKDSAGKYLDILDWNKYKAGFLNRQVIILLKTLKIKDTVFQDLQRKHIENISQMSFKDCSVFKHMNDDLNTEINNLEPANQTILRLIRAGFELESEPFFRGVLETMKKNGYNQLKVKCNIMVEKSARIIGIIDEYSVLEENQVYCSLYDPFSLKREHEKRQIIQDFAIITRNPCLDPADIRRVRCIGKDEILARFERLGFKSNKFEPYLNTVIFPQKGSLPLTAQISGSDLDGDNFWICWDENLIPQQQFIRQAKTIDSPLSTGIKKEYVPKGQDEMYKEMLDFFIQYINYEKLGQIDNSHLVKADQDDVNYAGNKDCMQLCEIHGKAVDFPKTGFCPNVDPKLLTSVYPDFMEKDQDDTYCSKSILGRLYREIKEKIQDLLKDKVYKNEETVDHDLIKNMEIDYAKEDIKDAFIVLREYEKTLANLISLVGIETEYELYSGNFSIAKEKVDQYGKNRLISTIINLRQRFFDIFFEENSIQAETYLQAEDSNLYKADLFSNLCKKKAVLFYLVSYIYKFGENLKLPQNPNFKKLRERVNLCMDEEGMIQREGKFCGFIWFILPKVIINIKKANISEKLSNIPVKPITEAPQKVSNQSKLQIDKQSKVEVEESKVKVEESKVKVEDEEDGQDIEQVKSSKLKAMNEDSEQQI